MGTATLMIRGSESCCFLDEGFFATEAVCKRQLCINDRTHTHTRAGNSDRTQITIGLVRPCGHCPPPPPASSQTVGTQTSSCQGNVAGGVQPCMPPPRSYRMRSHCETMYQAGQRRGQTHFFLYS